MLRFSFDKIHAHAIADDPIFYAPPDTADTIFSAMAYAIMRSMGYMPGLSLRCRLQGVTQIIEVLIDHPVPFRLGYQPTHEDYDYTESICMARRHVRSLRDPFDYPLGPYTLRLLDYITRMFELWVQPPVNTLLFLFPELREVVEIETKIEVEGLEDIIERMSKLSLYFPDEQDTETIMMIDVE